MDRPRVKHVLWSFLLLLVSPGSSAESPPGAHSLRTVPKAQSHRPLLALAGTDHLLPCSCPEETKSYLIWQKTFTVVAQYDPKGHEQDVDGSFRNRTHLYYPAEKDNCSLLLRRVSVKDEGNYSCFYKSERMKRFDVELLVAAQYTPQVVSVPPESEGSTGSGVYRCQAAGGYPVGRVHWLLDDQPVTSTFTTDWGIQDGLYNLNSTVSVGVPKGAVLRCVVENPRLEGSVSAELNCPATDTRTDEKQPKLKLHLPMVAVAVVACVVLILGSVIVRLLRRRQRSRCSANPEGPDGTVCEQEKPADQDHPDFDRVQGVSMLTLWPRG